MSSGSSLLEVANFESEDRVRSFGQDSTNENFIQIARSQDEIPPKSADRAVPVLKS